MTSLSFGHAAECGVVVRSDASREQARKPERTLHSGSAGKRKLADGFCKGFSSDRAVWLAGCGGLPTSLYSHYVYCCPLAQLRASQAHTLTFAFLQLLVLSLSRSTRFVVARSEARRVRTRTWAPNSWASVLESKVERSRAGGRVEPRQARPRVTGWKMHTPGVMGVRSSLAYKHTAHSYVLSP